MRQAFLIIAAGSLIVGCFLFFAEQSNQTAIWRRFYQGYKYYRTVNNERNKTGECELPLLDPWEPEVLPHLNFNYRPLAKCKVKTKKYTELVNGVLKQVNYTGMCEFRCLRATAPEKYETSEWQKMEQDKEYRPMCDFVEIQCKEDENDENVTFRYVHMQAKRPTNTRFRLEDMQHPSVFVAVIDSTSSSNGHRALPETLEVLRQRYGAIPFYHHNKAALNSRPNAFAMFLGIRTHDLSPNKKLFPNGGHLSEFPHPCQTPFKNEDCVVYDYVENGYATMIMEDWQNSFGYPNCAGYEDIPVTHWGRPYFLRTTRGNSHAGIFDEWIYRGECQDTYHKIQKYASEFLTEYRGIAKFSYIWFTSLAHESPSHLFQTDKIFADFFRKHAEDLSSSFVFLTADHGTRFGGIKSTQTGIYEDTNPLLVVTLPRFLRGNDAIQTNVRRNARRHTSHFDLFTTLYDIANIAPKENFSNWNYHNFRSHLLLFFTLFCSCSK